MSSHSSEDNVPLIVQWVSTTIAHTAPAQFFAIDVHTMQYNMETLDKYTSTCKTVNVVARGYIISGADPENVIRGAHTR